LVDGEELWNREAGKSTVNTKLDHAPLRRTRPLIKKHSFSGDVTLFGKKYDANYAPLTSDDGTSTGALFVGSAE
jgi:hypothetical protein